MLPRPTVFSAGVSSLELRSCSNAVNAIGALSKLTEPSLRVLGDSSASPRAATVFPDKADPLGSLSTVLLLTELSTSWSPVKSISTGILSDGSCAPCMLPGPDSCFVLANLERLFSALVKLWSSAGSSVSREPPAFSAVKACSVSSRLTSTGLGPIYTLSATL